MQPYSHVVVGLGASGFSAVRWLMRQGYTVAATDSRVAPPNLSAVNDSVPVVAGGISEQLIAQSECIVLSPGVPRTHPVLVAAAARGQPIIGDIELFARATDLPVIAITGTNAKSTVTTLVGNMAVQAGIRAGVGGNLGIPALDLLMQPFPELFVLELSSFQLESTESLCPSVASVLNVTPDHMDRYANFAAYAETKRKIYDHASIAVFNQDDPETRCDNSAAHSFAFTLGASGPGRAGLLEYQGEAYLALQNEPVLPVSALPIPGRHALANALAALAIGYAYGFPLPAMIEALKAFRGLPHRCQLVCHHRGVHWFNDSKGTNIGATLAALSGLGADCLGKIVLIAGGVAKGADFSPLLPVVKQFVKQVIVIGESADLLYSLFHSSVKTQKADSMANAVALAGEAATAGDYVLLSPACASFDMFANFEHRGNVFSACVSDWAGITD